MRKGDNFQAKSNFKSALKTESRYLPAMEAMGYLNQIKSTKPEPE